MTRGYEQYCPVAGALDVVGERWSLLLVRELLRGSRRYTDLSSALPGLSPTLLAARLRDLEAAGVVERRELPPPAARTVYALTPSGRELRPVVAALARWGVSRLPATGDSPVSPWMAWSSAVLAWFDPVGAEGVDAAFAADLGGGRFEVAVAGCALRATPPGVEADLLVEGEPAALVECRRRTTTFAEALADGRLTCAGSPAALDAFSRCFAFLEVPEEAHHG